MGAGFPYQLWFVVNRETYGECLRLFFNYFNMGMKRFFIFVLLLKSFYAIGAKYDFEVNGIYYQLVSREDRSVCVCNPGYNAYNYKDVVIPSSVTYAGYDFTVVGIRLWAFESCYDIKSLTLPETIEWIEQQAFDRCKIKKVNWVRRLERTNNC